MLLYECGVQFAGIARYSRARQRHLDARVCGGHRLVVRIVGSAAFNSLSVAGRMLTLEIAAVAAGVPFLLQCKNANGRGKSLRHIATESSTESEKRSEKDGRRRGKRKRARGERPEGESEAENQA